MLTKDNILKSNIELVEYPYNTFGKMIWDKLHQIKDDQDCLVRIWEINKYL